MNYQYPPNNQVFWRKIFVSLFIILICGAAFYIYHHHSTNVNEKGNPGFPSGPQASDYERTPFPKNIRRAIIKKTAEQNLDLNPFTKDNSIKKELYPYLTTPYFNLDEKNQIYDNDCLCKLEIIQKNNEKITISPNQKMDENLKDSKFIFTLKDNLKFSNGEAINKNTILFSYEQNKHNQFEVKLNEYPDNQFEINTKKDTKLKDVMKFLNQKLILVPETNYKETLSPASNKTEKISSYGTDVNFFISYGSYVLKEQVTNKSYKIQKSNGSDGIQYFIFKDKKEEEAFLNKQLDSYLISSPFIHETLIKYDNDQYLVSYINELKKQEDCVRMTACDMHYGEESNIVKNKKFREAFFCGIDRKKIFDYFKNQKDDPKTVVYTNPTYSYLPDNSIFNVWGLDGYNNNLQQQENINLFEFNKDKAQTLFNEVLETNKLSQIPLTIMYEEQQNVIDYQKIAELLKKQLESTFSDKLQITIKKMNTILPNQKSQKNYNNHLCIGDLKYFAGNLPYFTSLKNKNQPINDKLKKIVAELYKKENNDVSQMDYQKLETKLSSSLKESEFRTTEKENLSNLFLALENQCYEQMDDIPLLIKPQKIMITYKN